MERYHEVVSIIEHPSKNAVVILDETYFADIADQKATLENLFVLGRDRLMKEIENVPDELVPISIDPTHQNMVLILRLLLNDKGEFELLAYFGTSVDANTSLKTGLIHAVQVLMTLEDAL